MVRLVGEPGWRHIRSHAPFAMALDLAAPPKPVHRRPSPVVLAVVAGALAVTVAAALGFAARAPDPPALPAEPKVDRAPITPPAPVAKVPTMPTSVPAGTWATIPKPGDDVPDTPDNRLGYMKNVLTSVPGEPPIQKKAATVLMEKLRATLAKQCSVPLSAIKVGVGDASASITVAPGTLAHLSVSGQPRAFPVCSEGLFASSMLIAETTHEELSKAGVRGILCKSDGCVAVMNTRPTATNGGMYAGDACLSMAEMLRLSLQQ
jgi:hypothetical protein